jgi:hypothetical protein
MLQRNIDKWGKFVAQAQLHLEGADPVLEDALIVRVDVWIDKLQEEIRTLKYAEDIRLSRTMSVEAAEKLVIEQIANEELTKGNV